MIYVMWIACLVTIVVCDVRAIKVIDMSHVYDENTLFYNSERYFNLTVHAVMEDNPFYWAMAKRFTMVEHGGTHIDAPSHFFKDGRNLGEMPVEQFIGPAVIIDAASQAQENYDHEVTIEDLQAWESKNGPIPDGAIIIINFGWAHRWPNRQQVFGRAKDIESYELGKGSLNHHPGLHETAAKWLIDNRGGIHGVGSDCVNIDFAQSEKFMTHQYLLKNNIFILENLANINDVPNFATIYALPMKIKKGTGGPTRVIAVIGGSDRLKAGLKWVSVVMIVRVILMLFV